MARLLIHVEGQTEETFVNEVLSGHLYHFGFVTVGARLVGNCRQRNRRGGIRGWNTVRRDITNHLKEDRRCIVTTMVDYYALPQTGDKAWPGRAEARTLPFSQKPLIVEDLLLRDIRAAMGDDFNPRRFVPFVVMHEFEGLLFSDPSRFAQGIGRPDLTFTFQEIRDQFETPEEINDSPITAPSKRIEDIVPGYEKPLMGTLAVREIGFEAILRECPHFRDWINRLEQMGTELA